jgi:uncharacterized membrane protein
MDNLFYYIVVIGTLGLIPFGVFYIALAIYGIVRGPDAKYLPHSNLLVVSRLLSGVLNIMIGITLYYHLNESMTSIMLIGLTLIAFVEWELFTRKYFIEKYENNNQR